MGFFNREVEVIDNLTEEELENILIVLDQKDPSIFGLAARRFIQVDVRYSRFVGVRFKLTIPRSWLPRLSHATAVDMMRRGVVS